MLRPSQPDPPRSPRAPPSPAHATPPVRRSARGRPLAPRCRAARVAAGRSPRRRRGRGPDDGGPGAARRATPASGRGWRSRSTSRTTAAVAGELRLAGGAQGRTRFGTAGRPADPVGQDLPPVRPAAGVRAGARGRARRRRPTVVATTKVAFTIHDATQLVVGVVAERPGRHRRRASTCCPTRTSSRRSIVPLDPGGPARAGRGVGRPRPPRLAGRRLEPADDGPARGPARLARRRRPPRHRRRHRRPEQPVRLPGRPPALPADRHVDVARELADRPARRASRPAPPTCRRSAASWSTGRALATTGDRVVAAERAYGNGAVTLLGFDPTTKWIADGDAGEDLWRRLLPARSSAGPVARRRQPARRRGLAAAVARPAADRRPDRPARRLHPARRPGQLPRPQAPRPARVGVGHDAGPHRRLRRRRVRLRRAACAAATSSSTRSPSSAARRAPPTARPRSTSGSSRRRAAPTRSRSRAAPSCRRRSAATSSAATGPPRPSTSSRATRRGSATSPSASARCARSAPRRRSPCPLIEADLRLVDGRLKGTVTNASRASLERPAVVLGGDRRGLDDLAPGADGDGRRRRSRPARSASRCPTGSSARCSSATRVRRTADTTDRTSATRSSTS